MMPHGHMLGCVVNHMDPHGLTHGCMFSGVGCCLLNLKELSWKMYVARYTALPMCHYGD